MIKIFHDQRKNVAPPTDPCYAHLKYLCPTQAAMTLSFAKETHVTLGFPDKFKGPKLKTYCTRPRDKHYPRMDNLPPDLFLAFPCKKRQRRIEHRLHRLFAQYFYWQGDTLSTHKILNLNNSSNSRRQKETC